MNKTQVPVQCKVTYKNNTDVPLKFKLDFINGEIIINVYPGEDSNAENRTNND